jgi:hypothetical protein
VTFTEVEASTENWGPGRLMRLIMIARHKSLRTGERRAGLLIKKLCPTLAERSGQRLRSGTCWGGGVLETDARDKRQDCGHIASWGPG